MFVVNTPTMDLKLSILIGGLQEGAYIRDKVSIWEGHSVFQKWISSSYNRHQSQHCISHLNNYNTSQSGTFAWK